MIKNSKSVEIELKTVGEIIKGSNSDEKYLIVLDDSDKTGGYYIFICKDIAFINCHDMWVLNKNELLANISDYEIQWKKTIKLPEWVK